MSLSLLAALAFIQAGPLATAPREAPPAAVTTAPAAPPPAAAPAAPAATASFGGCPEGAWRQFDFWVGDWAAYEAGGTEPIAQVRVSHVADGCGLLEEVTPRRGPPSAALIVYDPEATLWRRQSVAGDGALASLEGGSQNGQMSLEGELTDSAGRGLARIAWRPDGAMVDESGERSKDGRNWSVWFDWELRRTR